MLSRKSACVLLDASHSPYYIIFLRLQHYPLCGGKCSQTQGVPQHYAGDTLTTVKIIVQIRTLTFQYGSCSK
uniref:Uncharacterized protein n=1 Tax=Anguilla anguilla TaxID=7936 RepID=A0A0E9SL27_ANGAN